MNRLLQDLKQLEEAAGFELFDTRHGRSDNHAPQTVVFDPTTTQYLDGSKMQQRFNGVQLHKWCFSNIRFCKPDRPSASPKIINLYGWQHQVPKSEAQRAVNLDDPKPKNLETTEKQPRTTLAALRVTSSVHFKGSVFWAGLQGQGLEVLNWGLSR